MKSAYDTGMASSDLTFDTESSKLLSTLSKDLNKMLTDYTLATGEIYDSTPALDSLNSLLYGEEPSARDAWMNVKNNFLNPSGG